VRVRSVHPFGTPALECGRSISARLRFSRDLFAARRRASLARFTRRVISPSRRNRTLSTLATVSGAEKNRSCNFSRSFCDLSVCEGRVSSATAQVRGIRGRNIHEVTRNTVDEAAETFDPSIERSQQHRTQASRKKSREARGLLLNGAWPPAARPAGSISFPVAKLSASKRLRYLSDLGHRRTISVPNGDRRGRQGTRKNAASFLERTHHRLHFEDIRLLLAVLQRLSNQGDITVVIEA